MNDMGNKRGYNSNQNQMNNKRYASNNQQYGRNNYGSKNSEKNPRNNNKNSQGNSMYGNICNTMQKKFNMTLYKGVQNSEKDNGRKNNAMRKSSNNQNKRFNVIDSKSSLNKDRQGVSKVQYNRNFNNKMEHKKDRETVLKDYSEEKNDISKYEEEVTEVLPKSVFVFITVAVIFVAALILTVANKDTVSKTLTQITDKKEMPTNDYDEGLDLGLDVQGELDSNQEESLEEREELEELEELELAEDDSRTSILAAIAAENDETKTTTVKKPTTTTKKTTTSTSKVATTTKKPTTVKKPTTTDSTQTDTTVDDEEIVEEENEEEVVEDVEMTFIPLTLTGRLWRCSSATGYGIFGADGVAGSFIKCSDSYYIECSNSVMVPKKDLNGIWLDVRGTTVQEYIGYKNNTKVQVVKIRLEEADSMSYKDIYAIKDTYINLGATYKKKGSTSTFKSIFATEDMELIRTGA
ncbi:MAG: hypothetical protein E7262_04325 [Lachnospiraceae bacterium]|nr:hypothetical protein [Lachnospiraceae bacterium]